MGSLPRPVNWLAWCSVAVALAGCGASGGSGTSPDRHLEAVAGSYVIDVERSIAAMPMSEITPSAAAEREARLRAVFATDAYSLDIEADGTFQLTFERGVAVHTISGICTASETSVGLTVTTVDGTALQDDARTVDTVVWDGEALVFADGGRSIYVTRR